MPSTENSLPLKSDISIKNQPDLKLKDSYLDKNIPAWGVSCPHISLHFCRVGDGVHQQLIEHVMSGFGQETLSVSR
jgi:hypothetical protein